MMHRPLSESDALTQRMINYNPVLLFPPFSPAYLGWTNDQFDAAGLPKWINERQYHRRQGHRPSSPMSRILTSREP
ncbi:hypothetical protein E2562_038058 [Oryza meyeriana var. granulata]|uniref:Uncharacterized protein n=1 Tax=Oryza meyeriana var. granulata TaxID=110450 RepID=A0A6G1EU54_9ORYZ|nr:hypothetical protein E2562_038058 [Oryza meyeriana var. granulata]